MNKLNTLILALCFIAFSGCATAGDLKLGVATSVDFSAYKGGKNDISVWPIIDYKNDFLYVDGTEAGVYLYQTDRHEIAITAYHNHQSFHPKDSDDEQMKKLKARHSTMMAGINYTYQNSWGAIDTQFTADTLNQNKGYSADLAYVGAIQKKRVTVAPRVGLLWHSNQYNNYYYGVSEQEARQTGFNQYQSKQGLKPYLELNINYQVSPKWDLFFSGRYEQLSHTIKNSPIVDKSNTSSIQLGIKFKL